MLIELPNGDWLDPGMINSVRLRLGGDSGPKVIINTFLEDVTHLVEFDSADAARGWVKAFGEECNEETAS